MEWRTRPKESRWTREIRVVQFKTPFLIRAKRGLCHEVEFLANSTRFLTMYPSRWIHVDDGQRQCVDGPRQLLRSLRSEEL